jgi:hypothetical protein
MRHNTNDFSWVEMTVQLCDQVLEETARANPANVLLRDLKEKDNQIAQTS